MTKPRFSFLEIAPLLFAIVIESLGFGMVYPVLTALFTDSAHSILPMGTSQSLQFFYLSLGFLLFPLFMFFGSSFMGDLSDLWGRKKVLMICMLGLAIGFGGMGLGITISSLSLLFFTRAFSGLMSACMPVAMASIADLSTEENKTIHMSFITFIQALGFVVGPLFGGILSDSSVAHFFTYSLPFYLAGLLAFLAFVWIYFSYQETFVRGKGTKIDLKKIYLLFVQVAKERAIGLLSLSFLFMQMGVAVYIQVVLIYFQIKFNYTSSQMGYFNGFLGFWMAFSLLAIIPYIAKKFKTEKIAAFTLWISALCVVLSGILAWEIPLWLLAIPFAISAQLAFATMLTSFSNSADKDSQGWVMGISGSVVALSFTITGLTPALVPALGAKIPIIGGGAFLCLSALLMNLYNRKYINIRGQ